MRPISEEKRNYILGHFLTDSNRSIMQATGVSLPVIYRTAKEAGLRRSDEYRDRANGKIELSSRQIEWLKNNFPNTDNWELADHLGISESKLHRLARKYHLTKTKAYMKRCQQEMCSAARYFHIKNGTYPKKGVYNENLRVGKEYQFKAGQNNKQRNGAVNERHRIAKLKLSRIKLIEEEKHRIKVGLPQLTRLKIVNL